MRLHSAAAEAIIRAFRYVGCSAAKTVASKERAEIWVQAAIAAGCHPHMRQEPSSKDGVAGEWVLACDRTGRRHPLYPGDIPEDVFDEVFLMLFKLGRVRPSGEFKIWHGNVWPDDCSPRALAFRMRFAREALTMHRNRFYGTCGINPKAGAALEAAHGAFASPDHEMLLELCNYHRIPEDWMIFGTAEEIEV